MELTTIISKLFGSKKVQTKSSSEIGEEEYKADTLIEEEVENVLAKKLNENSYNRAKSILSKKDYFAALPEDQQEVLIKNLITERKEELNNLIIERRDYFSLMNDFLNLQKSLVDNSNEIDQIRDYFAKKEINLDAVNTLNDLKGQYLKINGFEIKDEKCITSEKYFLEKVTESDENIEYYTKLVNEEKNKDLTVEKVYVKSKLVNRLHYKQGVDFNDAQVLADSMLKNKKYLSEIKTIKSEIFQKRVKEKKENIERFTKYKERSKKQKQEILTKLKEFKDTLNVSKIKDFEKYLHISKSQYILISNPGITNERYDLKMRPFEHVANSDCFHVMREYLSIFLREDNIHQNKNIYFLGSPEIVATSWSYWLHKTNIDDTRYFTGDNCVIIGKVLKFTKDIISKEDLEKFNTYIAKKKELASKISKSKLLDHEFLKKSFKHYNNATYNHKELAKVILEDVLARTHLPEICTKGLAHYSYNYDAE